MTTDLTQSSVARMIHDWMVRHELLPLERAAIMAEVIATYCCRCAPPPSGQEPPALEHLGVAGKLVAMIFCLEYLGPKQPGHADPFEQIRNTMWAARAGDFTAPADPRVLAVSDLLRSLAGPERRDIEAFAGAFQDHVDAAQEKASMPGPGLGPAGCGGAIDEYLRLRPLLIGTQPYLRCWQTLLGCWPDPAFAQTLSSLAPEVRRAHPHAGLDRALALASQGSARGWPRHASPLSEIDALVVIATCLANDLGSVERDRRSGGTDQVLNIVLLLERHFHEAPLHVAACPWNPGPGAQPALERAVAAVVDMHDVGIARLRDSMRLALARAHDEHTRRYLRLLARSVDGNLRSMLDLAAERAGTASTGDPAPAGQAIEPRYSSVSTLRRLRLVDDASEAPIIASDGV